jgi:predicted nucleic acid-binding protein
LILECAVQADAQIVVSGDRRHLLLVAMDRGARITTPQQLLAELANP